MNNQPKYKQVKDLILEDIRENIFPDGSSLPPENELMKKFNVSRNTVRTALKHLRNEGIIITHQGQQGQINAGKIIAGRLQRRIAWLDMGYVGNEDVYFEIFKHLSYCAEKENLNIDYINFQFSTSIENFTRNASAYKGIVITGRINDKNIDGKTIEALSSLQNIVSIDRVDGMPDVLTVGTDNYEGARMAVEHLVAAGREKIAFLGISGGFYIYKPFSERLKGYKDVIAKNKLCDVPELTVISAEISDTYDIRQLLVKTLKKHPDIDAFFAVTDFIAVQTLYALRGMDIKVPFDISVMGFDGLPIGERVSPRLTTVSHPFAEIAEITVKNIVNGKTFPEYIPVKPRLISGESV